MRIGSPVCSHYVSILLVTSTQSGNEDPSCVDDSSSYKTPFILDIPLQRLIASMIFPTKPMHWKFQQWLDMPCIHLKVQSLTHARRQARHLTYRSLQTVSSRASYLRYSIGLYLYIYIKLINYMFCRFLYLYNIYMHNCIIYIYK